MKLLIASDIHGSAWYNDLLVGKIRREDPDRILLLGDILYHGPRNDLPRDYDPKRVFKALNELKERIICVRGNCDSQVDQMVLEFPIMADYHLLYVDDTEIYMTHGDVYDPARPFPGLRGVLLYGHTHVPYAGYNDEGVLCLNPGSISLPKEDSRHSYMIYEDGVFVFRDLLSDEVYDQRPLPRNPIG